jgi:mRNA interferase MazF
MMRRFVICEAWDIAVVPFPFTDGPGTKHRPAAVLSRAAFHRASGHYGHDYFSPPVKLAWRHSATAGAAGLHSPCLLTMKLFTLDNRLIVKVIGKLPPKVREKARTAVRESADL